MRLGGEAIAKLEELLQDAFSPNQLRRLVRIHLDEDLDVISTRPDYQAIVFDLITWAERTSQVPALVAAASTERPRNTEFQTWQATFLRRATNQGATPSSIGSLPSPAWRQGGVNARSDVAITRGVPGVPGFDRRSADRAGAVQRSLAGPTSPGGPDPQPGGAMRGAPESWTLAWDDAWGTSWDQIWAEVSATAREQLGLMLGERLARRLAAAGPDRHYRGRPDSASAPTGARPSPRTSQARPSGGFRID